METPDCNSLRGRKRDICRGHDDTGKPVQLSPEKRQAYLRRWFPPMPTPAKTGIAGGKVGTELKGLLDWFRLEVRGSCQCAARANAMDERGIGWCEANLDTIVGWLMESWDELHLSLADFLPERYRSRVGFFTGKLPERQVAALGARWAVKTAIKRARRKYEEEQKNKQKNGLSKGRKGKTATGQSKGKKGSS